MLATAGPRRPTSFLNEPSESTNRDILDQIVNRMTHSESVQRAYSWAFNVYNNRKSRLIDMLCARQILQAIEDAQNNADVAYDAMTGIVREWSQRRMDSFEQPIKTLARILNFDPSKVESKSL